MNLILGRFRPNRSHQAVVPTCNSVVEGETRRSIIDGGGKGKLEVFVSLGLGDSKDNGGGEIGNCIGEAGANCWHRSTRRRRRRSTLE